MNQEEYGNRIQAAMKEYFKRKRTKRRRKPEKTLFEVDGRPGPGLQQIRIEQK